LNATGGRKEKAGGKEYEFIKGPSTDPASFPSRPSPAPPSPASLHKGQITLLLIYNRKEENCEERKRKRTFKIALEGDFLAAISMFFMKLMGPIVQTYAPDRKHRVIYFMHAYNELCIEMFGAYTYGRCNTMQAPQISSPW
jgi:hypothetical protein